MDRAILAELVGFSLPCGWSRSSNAGMQRRGIYAFIAARCLLAMIAIRSDGLGVKDLVCAWLDRHTMYFSPPWVVKHLSHPGHAQSFEPKKVCYMTS